MNWIPLHPTVCIVTRMFYENRTEQEDDAASHLFALLMCRLHPELTEDTPYTMNEEGTAYRLINETH